MVTAVDLPAVTPKAPDKDTSKVVRVPEWFCSDENLVEMYGQGMYIPCRSNVPGMVKESSVAGWKEFSTFRDNRFIIRMADPKGLLHYEGLSARETPGKLLSGRLSEDAETVLKEPDDRLNAAFGALDPEVQASHIAQPGYTVARDR